MAQQRNQRNDPYEWTDEMENIRRLMNFRFDQLEQRVSNLILNRHRAAVVLQNAITQTDTSDFEVMDSSVQTNPIDSPSPELQDAHTQTDTTYYQMMGAGSIRDSMIPIPVSEAIRSPKWTPLHVPPPIIPLSRVLSAPKAMEVPDEQQGSKVQKDLDVREVSGLPVMPDKPEILDLPKEPRAMELPVPLNVQEFPVVPVHEVVDVAKEPKAMEQLPEVPEEPRAMELPVPLNVQEFPVVPVHEVVDVAKEPKAMEQLPEVPEEPIAVELLELLDAQELPVLPVHEVVDVAKEPKAMEQLPEVAEEPIAVELLELLDAQELPLVREVIKVLDVANEPKVMEKLPEVSEQHGVSDVSEWTIAVEFQELVNALELPVAPETQKNLDVAKKPKAMEELRHVPELYGGSDKSEELQLLVFLEMEELSEEPQVNKVLDVPKEPKAMEELPEEPQVNKVLDVPKEPKAMEELPEEPQVNKVLDVPKEPKAMEVKEVPELPVMHKVLGVEEPKAMEVKEVPEHKVLGVEEPKAMEVSDSQALQQREIRPHTNEDIEETKLMIEDLTRRLQIVEAKMIKQREEILKM